MVLKGFLVSKVYIKTVSYDQLKFFAGHIIMVLLCSLSVIFLFCFLNEQINKG